jgi:hypothetical protein
MNFSSSRRSQITWKSLHLQCVKTFLEGASLWTLQYVSWKLFRSLKPFGQKVLFYNEIIYLPLEYMLHGGMPLILACLEHILIDYQRKDRMATGMHHRSSNLRCIRLG